MPETLKKNNKKTRKLIMTTNTTILNEIWKARNSFKHEQKKMQTANTIQNIKRNLKEIITTHHNKHEKCYPSKKSSQQRFMQYQKQSSNF